MKRKLLACLSVLILAGCYYNNEEELYNCTIDPASVRYTTTISGLLSTYGCTGCHSFPGPSAGINLTSHAGVKAVADNGRLWGSINHLPGFAAMPQGGAKMNACDLRRMKAWIDAGAPNN